MKNLFLSLLLLLTFCFTQCVFEAENDSNNQKPTQQVITENSDITQKRIMLMKWIDMYSCWDAKCVLEQCFDDVSAHVYKKSDYDNYNNDTISIWGNYEPFVYKIDSTNEDEIVISTLLKSKEGECICKRIFFPIDKMTSRGWYRSHYFKFDSKSIIPYKVGFSSLYYLIDERGLFYSNDMIIREKLFVEFLKTQRDNIKREYEWVVKYRGFKSLMDEEGNSKPCNIEVLQKTEQKIDNIQLKQVHDFLSDMKKECNTNAEYSEYSNEVLFLLLEKQTEILIYALEAKSSFDMPYILSQVSNPLLDYNLKALQLKIKNSIGSEVIKNLLIDALKEADKG